MVTTEKIEQKKRERFEVMAVRLAKHLQISNAETFNDLPTEAKTAFNDMDYIDIVRLLIISDKSKLGLSCRQLEVKYGVPRSTVSRITKGRVPK